MNDRDVIDAFVAHLRKLGHPDLRVERRPDEENRDTSDIDAIAGSFAIEHTSIDTLPNQRRDSDWFMRVVGGLEAELSSPLPFCLRITIAYDAVGKDQDWAAVRTELKNWVTIEAPRLPEGVSDVVNLGETPFRLHVAKSCAGRSGVSFARFEPPDDSLSARVKEAVDRKAAKLAKYQASFTTMLLIESDDIALMNHLKMLEAIRMAFPNGPPTGVNQVWYVDASIPEALQFREFTPELRKSDIRCS